MKNYLIPTNQTNDSSNNVATNKPQFLVTFIEKFLKLRYIPNYTAKINHILSNAKLSP